MRAYVEFEILEGAYEISCPDAMCPAQGVVTMTEIAALTSADLMTKHNRYRLNRGKGEERRAPTTNVFDNIRLCRICRGGAGQEQDMVSKGWLRHGLSGGRWRVESSVIVCSGDGGHDQCSRQSGLIVVKELASAGDVRGQVSNVRGGVLFGLQEDGEFIY